MIHVTTCFDRIDGHEFSQPQVRNSRSEKNSDSRGRLSEYFFRPLATYMQLEFSYP